MERIEKLLAQLTLEEKVAMVSGSGPWHSTGVERLGIPAIKVTDGPNGARGDARSGASAVCFPVGSCLAASWNPELIRQAGEVLAEEARSKGAQVLLGPTVNIHRHPLAGRNFECYSEDPHLSARIAVAFVNGVQSRGVGTSVKHFVCNDSEYQRHSINSRVGERALREIYLVPFEAAVKEADPWTVMSAYNRINGTFASSHHQLLTGILKKEWGFQGFVVSDWGASLETVENANGGLDLEMPGPARTMGAQLLAAVKAGQVEEKTLDDKLRRLLRVTILSGRMDAPEELPERSQDRAEDRALARRLAGEGMVLVKNDGLLPLDVTALGSVAVIGPNAASGQIQGGGSSIVRAHYQVHPLEAIRARLGSGASLMHEVGCRIDKTMPAIDPTLLRPSTGEQEPGLAVQYWNNSEFSGEPVLSRVVRRSRAMWQPGFHPQVSSDCFTARYSGRLTPAESGLHTFGLMSFGLSRLCIDGRELIDNWTQQSPGSSFFGRGSSEQRGQIELQAGREVEIRIDFQSAPEHALGGIQFGMQSPLPEDAMQRAVSAAASAELAILVVGTNGDWETEGNDRLDMELPGRQAELIERVAAANPRTVVVMNTGSPVRMDWLGKVPSVLQAWFPGQEFGNALADLLFGDVNPSGKLPTSFPVRLEDTPAFTNYPGENGEVLYGEGLFVGYRWYDGRDIEPLLPFGHGLSYTTFGYGKLLVGTEHRLGDLIPVRIDITNTGERAGQEVVQLYVKDLESTPVRPPKELKAFAKVMLEPGQTRTVEFELDERALAYWDPSIASWATEPGEFELLAGSSSRDIRSTARFMIG